MSEPLSDAEIEFLNLLGLSEDDVLQGWERNAVKDRQQAAEVESKDIVVGSPCHMAGHRLRIRSNNQCVQCHPEKFRYLKNYSEPGHVYIAGSLSGRLIKISFSRDCHKRVPEIRRQRYGGFGDWKLLEWFELENAGEIESRAQKELHHFNLKVPYRKGSERQNSKDLFVCSLSRASRTVREMLPWKIRMHKWYQVSFFDNDAYEFEDYQEGSTG
jgi:hypothetical protein